MTYKILVVDDEPANLRLLERLFRRDYQCLTASSGMEALQLLTQHDIALLITDQRMPHMTGLELLKQAASLRPHMVRIILTGYTDVGTLVEALNSGQVYKYVTKPWNNQELQLTVSRALEHYETNKSRHDLSLANQRLEMRLDEMLEGFVCAITGALEAKDEYLYGHATRVKECASAIGKHMGMNNLDLEWLSLAAYLHDIGKIGTPDALLHQPLHLTDEENIIVQAHAERGARIISSIPDLHDIADIVLCHHEHFDGSGYPAGLCGERIPLAARIILVADYYDSLVHPHSFYEAVSHEEAIFRLETGAGQRFDPEVVYAFKDINTLTHMHSNTHSNNQYIVG